MNYEKFLTAKLIKKIQPDFSQISVQMARALKDLKTAEANLEIDLTWSLTIAYHAMIRAGRALMFSRGFLPTANQSHKTIVEFTRVILGDKYHDIVARFNRLRRRRHDFIYESENHVTNEEAKVSLDTARKLVAEIIILIQKDNPQAHLF